MSAEREFYFYESPLRDSPRIRSYVVHKNGCGLEASADFDLDVPAEARRDRMEWLARRHECPTPEAGR